jgi:hypothetical protein
MVGADGVVGHWRLYAWIEHSQREGLLQRRGKVVLT